MIFNENDKVLKGKTSSPCLLFAATSSSSMASLALTNASTVELPVLPSSAAAEDITLLRDSHAFARLTAVGRDVRK